MLTKNKTFFKNIFLKTFLIFSILFLVGNISVNALFYFFPSIFQKLSSRYSAEIAYNELRNSYGSWNLESLESSHILGKESDRTEIIGDTLYARSGSKEEIISYYEQSLAIAENIRVRMKLAQILMPSWSPQSVSWESIPEKGIGSKSQSGSSPEIESANQRTQESSENREKYLQKPYETYIIQDSRDFLELGIERKDW